LLQILRRTTGPLGRRGDPAFRVRRMIRQLLVRVESYSRKRLLLTLAGLFAVCHAAYYLAGVRFDDSLLPYSMSILDLELLRHRMAQSIFYLHVQPPLFNLFTGLLLKVLPGHVTLAFNVCYVVLGFILYWALFALMRTVGVSGGLALGLSTWFMASPSFVLYEHWVFYTFMGATLLTLSIFMFYRVIDEGTPRQAVSFFGVLFLMGALQSMFHLIYYSSAMAFALIAQPRRGKMIVLTALLPLVLLTSVYAKNFLVFGKFTASTWLGMNFSASTVRAMPMEERRQLVAQGQLSPLALIPRFSPLSEYPKEYVELPGFEHVPALRQLTRSTGHNNYNHLAYIGLCEQYLADDLYIVAHRPKTLLVGLLNAWLCYFRSGSDYPFLYGNLDRIGFVNCLYDYLFYGKVPHYRVHSSRIPIYYAPGAEPRIYLFLIIGLPLLVWYGLRVGIKGDATSPALTRSQRMLVLYACFNIVYVALVGNLFEVSENHRFRFVTDPLYVMLCGLMIQRWALPRAASVLGKSACQSG